MIKARIQNQAIKSGKELRMRLRNDVKKASSIRESLKDWLGIVQSFLTCAAIVVAAIWFLHQEEPTAKANISHEITDRLLDKENRWIHVAITVTNPGKTLLDLESATVRIQQILPLDPKVESVLAHLANASDRNALVSKDHYVVYWPLLSDDYTPKLQTRVDPGESETLSFEFVIPSSIRTAKIYSYFSEREQSWFWKYYSRIFSSGRETLVWQKATIYDLKP